jgi:hypothetical protein
MTKVNNMMILLGLIIRHSDGPRFIHRHASTSSRAIKPHVNHGVSANPRLRRLASIRHCH